MNDPADPKELQNDGDPIRKESEEIRRQVADETPRMIAARDAAGDGLSVQELDAIVTRAKAATPGPWNVLCGARDDKLPEAFVEQPSGEVCRFNDFENDEDNAAHIAGMDPTTTLTLVAMARAAPPAQVPVGEVGEQRASLLRALEQTALLTSKGAASSDLIVAVLNGARAALTAARRSTEGVFRRDVEAALRAALAARETTS